MEIDLSFIGKPLEYELIGGPFDGSSLRIACDLFERPPKSITIQCEPQNSRGGVIEVYSFDHRPILDDDGEWVDEMVAYFYQQPNI